MGCEGKRFDESLFGLRTVIVEPVGQEGLSGCLHDVISLLVVKIDFLVREGAEFRCFSEILPPKRRATVAPRGPGENVYFA